VVEGYKGEEHSPVVTYEDWAERKS
jgi:hypothetical protein